jgi:hypothetical protein
MNPVKYTLIGDGSSDSALRPVINWLLNDLFPELPVSGTFAEFGRLKNPPAKKDVRRQVEYAQRLYPFDILIYHRDAEENTETIIAKRKQEVLGAIEDVISPDKLVCVVPVVMTEAWLLIDKTAIKKAAGNRNFTGTLALPIVSALEQKSNPKEILHELLKTARNTNRRDLAKFNVHAAVHLVADFITDFSTLRQLPSFREFERDLKKSIEFYLKEQQNT